MAGYFTAGRSGWQRWIVDRCFCVDNVWVPGARSGYCLSGVPWLSYGQWKECSNLSSWARRCLQPTPSRETLMAAFNAPQSNIISNCESFGSSLCTQKKTPWLITTPTHAGACITGCTPIFRHPYVPTPLCSDNSAYIPTPLCSDSPIFRHPYIPTPLCSDN